MKLTTALALGFYPGSLPKRKQILYYVPIVLAPDEKKTRNVGAVRGSKPGPLFTLLRGFFSGGVCRVWDFNV